MKTSFLRITTLTVLLAASSTGLFAGPGLDYWQRKQATRASAKAAAVKTPAVPASCPMASPSASAPACCKS